MSTVGYWLRLAWFKAGWAFTIPALVLGVAMAVASAHGLGLCAGFVLSFSGLAGSVTWFGEQGFRQRPVSSAARRAELARKHISELEREVSVPLADVVAAAELKAVRETSGESGTVPGWPPLLLQPGEIVPPRRGSA